MRKSRTEAAIKNSTASVVFFISRILLKFAVRTALIRSLGIEYTGVDGLFSNILSLLSLAELGFGSALVYSMYKPMAEGDISKLNALLKLYRSVYRAMGTFVLVVGFALSPFLNFFIHDTVQINNLYLIYILYIANSGLSYFFSYKSSVIYVAQENYIITLNRFAFEIIQAILQIAALFLYRNYIVFFSIRVVCTLLKNVSISFIANKRFPYILERNAVKLSKQEIKEIIKNTYALFSHKIGSVVVYGTDNLLISRFASVIFVGLYSNYSMLIDAASSLFSNIFSSLTSSIGNVGATENADSAYQIFKRVLFLNYVIAGILASLLFSVINAFIILWIGEDFLLEQFTVLLIILSFYLTFCRRTVLVFREAFGLFWYDRYKPFAEAAVNLIVSIVLGKMWGINGVIVGTIISNVSVSFWIEPYILYKYSFKRSLLQYFKIAFYFTVTAVCAGSCSYLAMRMISNYNLFGFILRGFVSLTICLFVYAVFWWRTQECIFWRSLFYKLLKRVTNK